jgi:hypothetical protein
MHMRELVKLAIGEFPILMANLDASVGVVNDDDAFSGQALVLLRGLDEIPRIASRNFVTECLTNDVTNGCQSWCA